MKRFRQFTLRTLLLAMLLAGIWLGWKRNVAESQKLAVEFVLSRNGRVGYDYEFDDAAYRLKDPILPTNKKLVEALGIDWFHSVVFVQIDGPLSDQDIAKVTNIKSIRGLMVGNPTDVEDQDGKYVSPDISAQSLERIGKLRHLQRLLIDVGEAESSGMAAWHKLSKLEELDLSNVDDSHVGQVARIPNLKRVLLWGKVTDDVAAEFSDEALLKLSESPRLQAIQVSPCISFKAIYQIKKAHPSLNINGHQDAETVILNKPMSVNDFKSLADLPSVLHLCVQNCEVDDEHMRVLPRLHLLKSFHVVDTNAITDIGIAHLAGLQDLASIWISENRISGTGFKNFSTPNLVKLYVDDNPVTDEGMIAIGRLTSLERLIIARSTKDAGDGNKVTDDGIAHLADLHRLKSMSLVNLDITDEALLTLQQMTALQKIELYGTNVTNAGVAALQVALPNCKIVH